MEKLDIWNFIFSVGGKTKFGGNPRCCANVNIESRKIKKSKIKTNRIEPTLSDFSWNLKICIRKKLIQKSLWSSMELNSSVIRILLSWYENAASTPTPSEGICESLSVWTSSNMSLRSLALISVYYVIVKKFSIIYKNKITIRFVVEIWFLRKSYLRILAIH